MKSNNTYEAVKAIGVDSSKYYLQVSGADAEGKELFNRRTYSEDFLEFMKQLPRVLVGMEACGGAFHWARELGRLGFPVKVMPAAKVKAFVANQKNDYADARACCEAALRKHVRGVAIKTTEQQALALLHSCREGYVQQKNKTANRIHSCLLEFGIAVPKGVDKLRQRVPVVLQNEGATLPEQVRHTIELLLSELHESLTRADQLERQIVAYHREDQNFRRLLAIEGVGNLSASAALMVIGDPHRFKSGRAFAAYLGLVPQQNSTGGKTILGHMSKAGSPYLRKLLIQGAFTALVSASRNTDSPLARLVKRQGLKKASIWRANKVARIIWALLAKEQDYCSQHVSVKKAA